MGLYGNPTPTMCMRKQKCVRRTRDGSLLIQREAANALQIPCRMSVGDKVSEVRSSSTLCLSKNTDFCSGVTVNLSLSSRLRLRD